MEEKKRSFETYETVVEVADFVTPKNKHLRFRLPTGKTLHFHSGQFVQMFIPDGDKIRRTSYSIASSPNQTDSFDLCVTHVEGGKSSTFLHHLKVGDKIQAMGPLGKFANPGDRESVFIATGSGIAPFRSMIRELIEKKDPRSMYLIFGNRFEEDIIYRKEWEELAQKNPNFKYLFTLSRQGEPWKGPKGYVQDHIQAFIPNYKDKNFFICGLTNMINAVEEKLKVLGVPHEQIHYERYD